MIPIPSAGAVRAALGQSIEPDPSPLEPSPIYNDTNGASRSPAKAQSISQSNAPGKITLPSGRWVKYAGKLGAGLTVTASAHLIRRGGHEPNKPDDPDVELLEAALQEGLRLRFGDGPVPWWLGAALAAGGVYATMRIGAKKLPPNEVPVDEEEKGAPTGITGLKFPPPLGGEN